MNLTLKQLFKFGAACACACALSATAATNYVADSFEVNDGGSEGLPISQYKYTVENEGEIDEVTNYAWFAESGDASLIVTNDAAYASYNGDGPLTGAVADLVLDLATEGNTLSRTVGEPFASGIYIDTMVQFTPSEDDPDPTTLTNGVKIALWVNAQSNLVVNHAMTSVASTNSVLAVTIKPDKWYRLTMEVNEIAGGWVKATRLLIDGVAVTHANAYESDGTTSGGEWFLNVATGVTVENISFQGTGKLDEFVVTDTLPVFDTPSAVMLTLMDSGDGTVTFKADGIEVTQVASGTEVVMTVDDWYQMTGESGSDATFASSSPISGNYVQDHTATFTAENACTVTVSTATLAGPYDIGGGANINLADLSAWGQLYSYPQADVEGDPSAFIKGFTLGISTNDAATTTLKIASIDVDSANDETIITVEAEGDNDQVNFQNLGGGVVTVYTNSVLDGTFGLAGSYGVELTDHDYSTVVVTNDLSELFIKAKVELKLLP